MHDAIELLKLYTPTLYACAMRNRRTEKLVVEKYDKRWDSMKNDLSEKCVFSAKTCLFDLLWKASEKDADAEAFLSFIDRTANDVLSSIKDPVRRQL